MGETVQSLVGQAGGGSSLLGMLPVFVGMIVIMYFLMIRPERKRQAEQASMLGALKRGDEVALTSGIIGKIDRVEDRFLIVEIADKTRIKVLKQAVSGPAARFLALPADAKAKADDKATDKADDKKDDEKKSA
jgi:preprotein translocase subunit YajC